MSFPFIPLAIQTSCLFLWCQCALDRWTDFKLSIFADTWGILTVVHSSFSGDLEVPFSLLRTRSYSLRTQLSFFAPGTSGVWREVSSFAQNATRPGATKDGCFRRLSLIRKNHCSCSFSKYSVWCSTHWAAVQNCFKHDSPLLFSFHSILGRNLVLYGFRRRTQKHSYQSKETSPIHLIPK